VRASIVGMQFCDGGFVQLKTKDWWTLADPLLPFEV
jgi:hypothetical protein